METLADRLKHAMRAAGMNQKQLADAVGVKPPSVNGWLSEKAKFLRGENLLRAAQVLGVSENWLATGQGRMRVEFSGSTKAPRELAGALGIPDSASQPARLDIGKLAAAIGAIDGALENLGLRWTPAAKAEVVDHLYTDVLSRTSDPAEVVAAALRVIGKAIRAEAQ